jgi:hypothetical protein
MIRPAIISSTVPTTVSCTSLNIPLPVNNALRNCTRESDIKKWFGAKELLISRYFRSPPPTKVTVAKLALAG